MLCVYRLMPLPEVLRLPEVAVEEESKLVGESCPVCLETYQVGDKVSSYMFILRVVGTATPLQILCDLMIVNIVLSLYLSLPPTP